MSKSTADAARGRWPGILSSLGIDPKFLKNMHGPCPLCGGKDRYRFDDKEEGRYYCSQCGPGDGFELLMKFRGWTFREAADQVDQIVGSGSVPIFKKNQQERSAEELLAATLRLIRGAGPVIEGTAAWLYLRQRCGAPEQAQGDLRAHPGLFHRPSGSIHPTLLAILRNPEGEVVSAHRTFLTTAGQKAPVDPARMLMPGPGLSGAAVRLGPVQERIGITEGIETALCAGLRFGFPVWAALSAGGLQNWRPPVGVHAVEVFGDNDSSFTGQCAAFALAKKLRALGLDVNVNIPAQVDTDWADLHEPGGFP